MSAPTVDRTAESSAHIDDASALRPGAEPPPLQPAVEEIDLSIERRAGRLAALAAWCAAAAAAWVLSGVFPGIGPRVLAVAVSAIGPAAVAWSVGQRRAMTAQLGSIAAVTGLAAGAGLAGRQGDASLPRLIADALRSGGLAEAPIPFDPGWRAILVVAVGLLGVCAAGLAVALRRPRAGVLIAVPVVAGATLVQPADAEVVSAAVALALMVAGLGVAAAADLVREGASSGRFELRRAWRGAVLLVVLVAALVATSRVGALLPPPKEDAVVPPQRPEPSPPLSDRVLFRVKSERPLPWRLGTLDVYDGSAWLTPPYDPSRFEELAGRGTIPTPSVADPGSTVEVSFEVAELAGRALPSLANPVRVITDDELLVDPRTQVVRLPSGTSSGGREYRVVAAAPPTGAQLAQAGEPGRALAPFLEVPPPPPEVADLIDQLPDASDFDRLQAAREAYYSLVVAAGAGDPTDVTPGRVAELLSGREGSPFEITAGEALIARWVGVPSRLGYGWFGGDNDDDGEGETVVRPEHGATWLEAWFEGSGWVPIVGKPPRAKSSLSKNVKDDDPSVRPTDRLTVFTYVPVRTEGLRQAAAVARHYAVRVVPIVLAVVLGFVIAPAVRKLWRRRARRRWAAAGGPPERLAAAYAELRDVLVDLGASRPSLTPLEVLDAVDDDDEHTELAWLVTRGLWGDLQRDLTPDDAATGEALAESVRRRVLRAQTLGARVAGLLSRSSLREPWGDGGIPGSHSAAAADGGPRRGRATARFSNRAVAAAGVTVVALVVGIATFAATRERTDAPPAARGGERDSIAPLPDPLVPVSLGGATIARQPSAEDAFGDVDRSLIRAGRVYSVSVGTSVEASLQAAVLRDDVAARGDEVVDDVLRSLGGGGFRPARFGRARGYSLTLPEQRLLIWFTPDLSAYQLLVARRSYEGADELFAQLLAMQAGEQEEGDLVVVPDPRRGLR